MVAVGTLTPRAFAQGPAPAPAPAVTLPRQAARAPAPAAPRAPAAAPASPSAEERTVTRVAVPGGTKLTINTKDTATGRVRTRIETALRGEDKSRTRVLNTREESVSGTVATTRVESRVSQKFADGTKMQRALETLSQTDRASGVKSTRETETATTPSVAEGTQPIESVAHRLWVDDPKAGKSITIAAERTSGMGEPVNGGTVTAVRVRRNGERESRTVHVSVDTARTLIADDVVTRKSPPAGLEKLDAAGVRVVRTKSGLRYQDMRNRNKFITREEALLRALEVKD